MENTKKFNSKLQLITSPHLRSWWTTSRVMWLVVLALLPCVVAAVVYFGFEQLGIIAFAILFANIAEAIFQKIRSHKITILDGSATVTGLILALTLPPDFPLTLTIIGVVVAMALGKHVFGGLGHNIFNPALVGRAFLVAAFPIEMTTWKVPLQDIDTITSATPLSIAKFDGIQNALLPMFYGNTGGCIGETSALAILLGGIFLIFVGIVNWRIPVSCILALLLFSGILKVLDPIHTTAPLYQILAGGFLFATFFMATDWTTSPVTNRGMLVFGFGIALIVVFIRAYGGLAEGVMYAILLMNALVPIINRYTHPRIFGERV